MRVYTIGGEMRRSTTMYQLLVDAVVMIHLAFVLFAALGAFAALRWRRLLWLHVPAVAWGVWIELTDGVCPLTPLEDLLRRAGGLPPYRGDFIERYVTAIVYPVSLTRSVQVALALALVGVNAAIYAVVWRRWRTA